MNPTVGCILAVYAGEQEVGRAVIKFDGAATIHDMPACTITSWALIGEHGVEYGEFHVDLTVPEGGALRIRSSAER